MRCFSPSPGNSSQRWTAYVDPQLWLELRAAHAKFVGLAKKAQADALHAMLAETLSKSLQHGMVHSRV
eukprot:14690957-Alexandrium_andersonii.AAC.1